jgi:hypothetical protein
MLNTSRETRNQKIEMRGYSMRIMLRMRTLPAGFIAPCLR